MVTRQTSEQQAATDKPSAALHEFFSRKSLLIIAVAALGVCAFGAAVLSYTQTHIPFNVYIDGQSVAKLTLSEAAQLTATLPSPTTHLLIQGKNAPFEVSSDTTQLLRDDQRILTTISKTLHNTPLTAVRWWLASLTTPTHFSTPVELPEDELAQLVTTIDQTESVPGTPARVTLARSGVANTLEIDPGTMGSELDSTASADLIQNALHEHQAQVELAYASPTPPLTADEVASLQERALRLVGQTVVFQTPDKSRQVELTDQTMIALLGVRGGIDHEQLATVIAQWEKQINRPPQNAKLEYDASSLQVTAFVPPLDGLVLDVSQLQSELETYVLALSDPTTIGQEATTTPPSLPLTTAQPSISLADTNSLGIRELIGHGQSEYDHSIATRIHNVSLATERVTDFLLAPGAEFSFNRQIGDVSAATGFKPAYIIKQGKTELGDGGGVCQVSTTLFRAALNAGLDITKRRAHSYRVSYYELDTKPGIDATVYSGDVDLRFINDTPGYILIHGEADPKTLRMFYNIYGTNDGRVASITDHITWDARPAAPPEYIEDPSLPPGTKKQIDWAAPGLRAKFTYTVTSAAGQVLHSEVFASNYVPWSAKYLVGPATQ